MKDALVTLRNKLRAIRRASTDTQDNRGPIDRGWLLPDLDDCIGDVGKLIVMSEQVSANTIEFVDPLEHQE